MENWFCKGILLPKRLGMYYGFYRLLKGKSKIFY